MKELTISRLEPQHLGELARIRRSSFSVALRTDAAEIAGYLASVFIDNPWSGEPSLCRVATVDREVAGFIGLIPRPMRHRNRGILMASVSHVMVDERFRGMGVGRRLLADVFAGEQDLTLSDVSNEALRRIWHAAGGVTDTVGCLSWERSFRPLRSATRVLGALAVLRPARLLTVPICAIVDPLLSGSSSSSLHVKAGDCVASELQLPSDLGRIQPVLESLPLAPVYTADTLSWLIRQLVEHPAMGPLRGDLVLTPDGEAVGWSLMSVSGGIHGQLVQLAARPGAELQVVQAVFHRSWRAGIHTLRGRASPALVEALSTHGATMTREDPWCLLHSRDPALLVDALTGPSLLSRLEGEWWVGV